MTPKINVVGIGLDGKAGLISEVCKLVESATVLVGSDRHLNLFPEHSSEKFILGDFLTTFETIKQKLQNNEKIVILVSGDPLFFGLGRLLLENFPSEQLVFHPHYSSVQLAFNRLKLPWHDAQIVSVHGRSLDLLLPLLQKGINKIAILTDSENNPSAIAAYYQSLDLAIHYEFWICENLGGNNERIYQISAEKLSQLNSQDFAPLNVVILVRKNDSALPDLDLTQLPLLGLPDSSFLSFEDRPGLMTKREIRLIVLGELALQPDQVIWDIGAGTGSVSIEIARLCPDSQIYAIEKTAMGVTLIERNAQRFQVNNINPIQGKAPKILADLPNPDRIFIGGTGGNLTSILTVCQAQLNPLGKIILALATMEHFATCLSWFKEHDWNYSYQQIQISRSLPLGDLTRLNPLNPVMIISAIPVNNSPNIGG
ncbi:MAG: precorrin-6y C5,15-methyltransferase (decarboxylating) subunit CbiE [Snowella sp.]|nr:precorrin-6y C5,15-methyltransferase (decarboxylating) subunit CbiE [Snowella sp.]